MVIDESKYTENLRKEIVKTKTIFTEEETEDKIPDDELKSLLVDFESNVELLIKNCLDSRKKDLNTLKDLPKNDSNKTEESKEIEIIESTDIPKWVTE